jgi:uncharacterized protein (TIGR00369 family)
MDQPIQAGDLAAADLPAGPWQEPVRGGHPPVQLNALSGADQLRAMFTGASPQPPLSHLTGMRLEDVGDGTATFSMPMSPWLAGEDGAVALGPLTIPADAAMACAIISRLAPHTGLTTTELSLRQLRRAPLGETLRAEGRVIDFGPQVALAQATLYDEAGNLIALAGSLCVTLALVAETAVAEIPHDSRSAPDRPTTPDPWQRPDAPAQGVGALTGLCRVQVGDGCAQFVLPATAWLCAPPPGRAQGGAVALLAEAATTAAIREGDGETHPFTATEMKVNYLRPLASDGRLASGSGRLIHRGRRIGVAEARVHDASGRLIAMATGSAVAGHEA